jgi:hypothetical protein
MVEVTSVVWELGSDFDMASADLFLAGEGQPLPWSRPNEPITYVESGRQALALVSMHLRARGYSNLLMPSHFCDSMLAPFLRDGWTINFTDVDESWRCLPPRDLSDPEKTLVFSMAFFGVEESPGWIRFLLETAGRGAAIVSDETHRVLGKGLTIADFRVASLRKMLPVPDGGFVAGLSIDVQPGGRQAAVRGKAMRSKSAYLAGQRRADHLPLYSEAEAFVDREVVPAQMSGASRELLKRFDYRRMQEARKKNHQALSSGLASTGFTVTTNGAPVPSHCVVVGSEVERLRAVLARKRVFCPVHWPRSELMLPPNGEWRTDIISIPVDHRYTEDEMEFVAETVRESMSPGLE